MKNTRLDYFNNKENNIESNYKTNLSIVNTEDFSKLITSRFSDPKVGIKEYLNSFRERAGLKDYLKQINAELENQEENIKTAQNEINSILDIPDIKSSIDSVLAKGEFNRTIDLLNKLQEAVKYDDRIPEDLKGVTQDAELVNYIKSKIDQNINKINYMEALQSKEPPSLYSDQKNMSYFNFDGNSKEYDESE